MIRTVNQCGSVTIQFNNEELVTLMGLAWQRNKNKTNNNIGSYVEGNELKNYEAHIIGMYGEMAVALDLNLEIDNDIYLKGDNGVDFTYKGRTIDVKTTTKNEDQLLTFKRKDKFIADIAILCEIVSPNCVNILSCCTIVAFHNNAKSIFDGSVSLRAEDMYRYGEIFHKKDMKI